MGIGVHRSATNFVRKDWGSEYWFVNCDLYCGKAITCRDGIWSSGGKYHYHEKKDETFFILEGELELDIEGTPIILRHLCEYRIMPGVRHRFRSHGDRGCKFIEVSTHHDDADSIRVD